MLSRRAASPPRSLMSAAREIAVEQRAEGGDGPLGAPNEVEDVVLYTERSPAERLDGWPFAVRARFRTCLTSPVSMPCCLPAFLPCSCSSAYLPAYVPTHLAARVAFLSRLRRHVHAALMRTPDAPTL